MNIENIGTNFWAYLPLAFVLLLVIIAYFMAKTGWDLSKTPHLDVDDELKKKLQKSYIRKMVALAVVFVFFLFSLFFAYGPGKRVRTTDYEKSGWMERVEKLPDEKPIAIITEEGNKHQDKTGTLPKVASEEEYKKSKEEADKEIESILQRNQNN